MTIGTTFRSDASGNDAATSYPYGFKIFAESHLSVVVRNVSNGVETELVYPTHFSVTGVGAAGGGNVVLLDTDGAWQNANGTLKTGYAISIRREVPVSQGTDIRNQGGFFADVHEDTFDYLTMILQQHEDTLLRSIRWTESFDPDDFDSVLPTPSAGMALGWNATEDGLTNLVSVGTVGVSAFMETVLDDTTAAGVFTTLGISAAVQAALGEATGPLAINALGGSVVPSPRMQVGGMNFNGSTTYLDGNALTGIADGKEFTWFGTVRFANAASAIEVLHDATGTRFQIARTATGELQVRAANSAAVEILNRTTITLPCAAAGTYRILLSVDLTGTTPMAMYVNEVAQTFNAGTFTNDTIDFTTTEHSIGATVAGASFFTGDFYTLAFLTSALTLSQEAVRRRFYSIANNDDEYMGEFGEMTNPSGTPPVLFLAYDRGAGWPINKGSATGTFVQNGTIATVSTATIFRRFARHVHGGNNLIGGTIVHSRSGNAETIAVKHKSGNDPSAQFPVYVVMRDQAATTGGYVLRPITAALSITIANTSTMGMVNSIAARLWSAIFDDAGTLRLGVINCLSTTAGVGTGRDVTALYPLKAFGIASSTAEGGGAADNAQVFYTTTAVSAKPYTAIGYATWESGLAAIGVWDTAPSRIQLFGPGVPLPGEVIQIQRNANGTMTTGVTTVPGDNTIPQITEGDQYLSQAITPTSAANVLQIESAAALSASGATPTVIFSLHKGGVNNAVVSEMVTKITGGFSTQRLIHKMLAEVTSAITFSGRAGAIAAATTTFNGTGGVQYLGGVLNSFIEAQEIMA